jgi:hypothetical protein
METLFLADPSGDDGLERPGLRQQGVPDSGQLRDRKRGLHLVVEPGLDLVELPGYELRDEAAAQGFEILATGGERCQQNDKREL